MNIAGRIAIDSDIKFLAAMNRQLIRDEGHRNAKSVDELERRMQEWLHGEYEAVLFSVDGTTVGYALYKEENDGVYLRQFFIAADHRRRGIGRASINWLLENPWRDKPRIRLDVLTGNADGLAFWRSIGFQDYCITMELDVDSP